MAKMTFKAMKNEGQFQINGAFVYYTKLKGQALKMEHEFVKGQPFANKEYTVELLITKEIAKQIKKSFDKPTFKTVDAEDFEDIYKVAPPFEADEYVLLKLTQHASYPDGKPNKRNIVKLFTVEDKKATIVGLEKIGSGEYSASVPSLEVGNGSEVLIVVSTYTYKHKGKSITKPITKSLYVTDLVEYQGGEGNVAEEADELGFEFDEDEGFVQDDDNDTDDGFDDDNDTDDDWDD